MSPAPARHVYLDYSATTPVDPRVVEAMRPFQSETFGNSHSAHIDGRRAETAVEEARERVAQVLGCKHGEIVFTSGGTESDNLAIRGTALAGLKAGKNHLVTTPVEHSAVGKTMAQLSEYMPFETTLLPVDQSGLVDAEDLADAVRPTTGLVSIIYANNEIGTVQPLARLAQAAHERGALFHTDAVQAPGQLSLDVKALDVDLMSISAHKFYGPKGVGALYVREGISLVPAMTGGSHEEGRRGGTLNTAGIVGMAHALALAAEEMPWRVAHYTALRDRLTQGILQAVPDAIPTGHPTERLASHASFIFDGLDGSILLMHLDMKGVSASSASACKTGNPEPSGVLLALGYPHDTAMGSIRLTVGKDTSVEDVDYAIQQIGETVAKLRRLRQQYA
ncbi:MAG: cysteine desulfurase [Pleurocapsa minor GSE-CHR-MK-17-07R]|nr:cysteine desulfurase [Pleurocapsa minor GSE-CHR-MK 17-07R]